LKPKYFMVFFFFLLALGSYPANGETRTKSIVRLVECTNDDLFLPLHRGNSVDYRSSILIKLVDSVTIPPPGMKMKIEVIRKNGRGFEIFMSKRSPHRDSGTVVYDSLDRDTSQNVPLEESYVHLRKWAVEPGDKIHFKVYEGVHYSFLFERYVPIKKHGLQGNLSFPILSVQRADDHPGSLGAGISYTGKYVHRDQRLLDKLGWGANLSFLDFDPNQKIEIGLGFVLTFPDDIFQLGVGKNLTVNHASGYYFLGINLFGIKEKIGW